MHHSTVRKILANEEVLDIGATAKAVQEDVRLRSKKDKSRSRANSLRVQAAWLARQKSMEAFRLRLREVWNKNKKS